MSDLRRASQASPARLKHNDGLWPIVEGAIVDAFRQHPEYLTEHGQLGAVESITKRVVGTLRSAQAGGRESGS